MSKERLSKLQKWILQRCYEADQKGYSGISRSTILKTFFSQKWQSTGELTMWNNAQVILTKSLKSLARRGYIELMGTIKIIDPEPRDAISKLIDKSIKQGKSKEETLRVIQKSSPEDLMKPFRLKYTKIPMPIKPDDRKHKIKAICIAEKGKQKVKDMELSLSRKRLIKDRPKS